MNNNNKLEKFAKYNINMYFLLLNVKSKANHYKCNSIIIPQWEIEFNLATKSAKKAFENKPKQL